MQNVKLKTYKKPGSGPNFLFCAIFQNLGVRS
jgi:hypothetical protein